MVSFEIVSEFSVCIKTREFLTSRTTIVFLRCTVIRAVRLTIRASFLVLIKKASSVMKCVLAEDANFLK